MVAQPQELPNQEEGMEEAALTVVEATAAEETVASAKTHGEVPNANKSGEIECSECGDVWEVTNVTTGEIIQCPGCSAELEITDLETTPFTTEKAPEEQEDWGE